MRMKYTGYWMLGGSAVLLASLGWIAMYHQPYLLETAIRLTPPSKLAVYDHFWLSPHEVAYSYVDPHTLFGKQLVLDTRTGHQFVADDEFSVRFEMGILEGFPNSLNRPETVQMLTMHPALRAQTAEILQKGRQEKPELDAKLATLLRIERAEKNPTLASDLQVTSDISRSFITKFSCQAQWPRVQAIRAHLPKESAVESFASSPDGKENAYLLQISHATPLNFWLNRLLPHSDTEPNTVTALYVSDRDGGHMREVAWQPDSIHPGASQRNSGDYKVRWVPDGKHISFACDNTIWMVTVN